MVYAVKHEPHSVDKGDGLGFDCPGDFRDCPITKQVKAAYRQGVDDAHRDMNLDKSDGSEAPTLKTFLEEEAKKRAERKAQITKDPDSFVKASFSEDVPDLIRWWVTQSATDIMSTQEKVQEYGGYNMVFVGRALLDFARNAKNLPEHPSDGYLQELAVWFYEVGKLGRALVALQNGTTPSDDTVLDVGYYAMMMRRMRQNGQWP